MVRTKKAPILLVVGTRPEGIKMAPVYHALRRAELPMMLCSTMQHGALLTNTLDLFDIVPDISLRIMRPGQDLFYLTQAILQKMKETLLSVRPILVLVQGDTTSSMAAALAAFYLNIPVGHIEAGLRTDDIQSPFPEEMNRRLISMIATYHFAPTSAAVKNLMSCGLKPDQIFHTGNTVVDALYHVREKIRMRELTIRTDIVERVMFCKQRGHSIVVCTVHRREALQGSLEHLLRTIKEWAIENPNIQWFYPYHPNPHIVNAICAAELTAVDTVHLCEPMNYQDFIYLLDASTCVLTDSGGVQEEAVSLSKPVLVLRDRTERIEGILSGDAYLIGSDAKGLREGMEWAHCYQKDFSTSSQIYGDGHAAERIVAFVQAQYDYLCARAHSSRAQTTVRQTEGNAEVKRVSVVGLGYIGLPTAIIAAEAGNSVIGFDIDKERVAAIKDGDPVIQEPGVYEKLNFVLNSQQLRVSTSIEPADYFIIAVPTPITNEKKADLSCVYQAATSITSVLCSGNVVIIESTVPVGTTKKIAAFISEKTGLKAGSDFFIAYCPERVLPGNIFHELVVNDRVIGGINELSAKWAQQFYRPFVTGNIYVTSSEKAEMVKLVENSSRDVLLAFAHQIGSMASSMGIDPYEIIDLANKHPRVNILRPTCGVGGHCIAIDPWFLVESFPNHSCLVKTAREVNDAKPQEVIARILKAVEKWRHENLGICTVLLLGVGYKANSEDMRESPALFIAKQLMIDNSMYALVTDPHVEHAVLVRMFESRVVTMSDGVKRADIVVFLVAHDRFKLIDRKTLERKQVLDFCGVLHEPLQQMHEGEFRRTSQGSKDFFVVNRNIKSENSFL